MSQNNTGIYFFNDYNSEQRIMTSHIDVHGKMLIHIMMYEHDELKSISIHIDQLQMQELYEMIAMYYDHKKATK